MTSKTRKSRENYNGQSHNEYFKNYDRIRKIVSDTDDIEKQIKSAQKQANLITDEIKALNRSKAAKELGYDYLFDVFFYRAYQLGSVGKQEFREYQLTKMGIV